MKVEYNDYELVYLVREQNEAALDILIQKYSPLIGKIASSYYGVGFLFLFTQITKYLITIFIIRSISKSMYKNNHYTCNYKC